MPIVPLFISFALGLLLVTSSGYLLRYINRHDIFAKQAAHVKPTLRLGGLAIYLSLWITVCFEPSLWSPLGILLSCATPVVAAGLFEDIGMHQSIARRLVAGLVSCIFVVLATDTYITGLNIPALDLLLSVIPFAIAFTLFSSVGIVNAFNLIDGLDGLASFAGLICLLGLSGVALRVGHPDIVESALTLGGAILGFLVLNFPKGRIFLGDGGAYLLGFVLAWLAIDMMSQELKVSPWAVLLIFFWPVADTLWAMWRRAFRKATVSHADRMHFHHVVMRFLEIRFLGRGKRHVANPLATLVLVVMMSPPAITGIVLATETPAAITAVAIYAGLFLATYYLFVKLAPRRGVVQWKRTAPIALVHPIAVPTTLRQSAR